MTADDGVSRTAARRHDAFISYHNKSSRRVARYLQRELERIAKNALGDSPIRIFRDETNLTFSDLGETLRHELDGSHRMLLVLHRDTRASPWVNEEVRYWLANGGAPERLTIVRADPDLDLTWDPSLGSFAHDEQLPESIRGVFHGEPLWVDLSQATRRFSGADTGELARLCATILERDPEELLRREIVDQRRRQRRLRMVLIGVASLALIAVATSVVAVKNRSEAILQEQEARAQADAAESLLLSKQRPDKAIEKVIAAARSSSSATVRTALLTVINDNSGMDRLLPSAKALGYASPTRVTLNHSGTRLVGQVNSSPGGSVALWDTTTGQEIGGGHLEESIEGDPVFLDDDSVVYCTPGGARMANIADSGVEVISLGQGDGCSVWSMNGGAMVMTKDQVGAEVVMADMSGNRTSVGPVSFAGAHPLSDVALISGTDGLYRSVRASGKSIELDHLSKTAPEDVIEIDQWGRVLLRARNGRWWRGTAVKDKPGEFLPVPRSALAAAPIRTDARDAIWITPRGTVEWNLGQESVRLPHVDAPSLMGAHLWVSDSAQRAVAIYEDDYGSWATTIDLSTWEFGRRIEVVDTVEDIQGEAEEIAVSLRAGGAGFALQHGEEGSVLFNESTAREFSGPVVVDPSSQQATHFGPKGLEYIPLSDFSLEPISIDTETSLHSYSFNSDGSLLAVARPAAAVALYSTARLGTNPLVEEQSSNAKLPAALGEVTFEARLGAILRSQGGDDSQIVYSAPEGSMAYLAAVSPDGAELVALVDTLDADSGSIETDSVLVKADASIDDLDGACNGATSLQYLPRPGFAQDMADAESSRLVKVNTSDAAPTFTDCRTGEEFTYEPIIDDYEISASHGRIVWSTPGEGVNKKVTTWNRGDPDSLRSVDLLAQESDHVAFDANTTIAAQWSEDSATVQLSRESDGQWRADQSVTPPVTSLRYASPIPAAGLLAVVGDEAGVFLYDLDSGRLVLRYQLPDESGWREDIQGVATEIVDGQLRLTLAESISPYTHPHYVSVVIPLDIGTLSQRLCSLAPSAEGC